jgi:hypothetical protein
MTPVRLVCNWVSVSEQHSQPFDHYAHITTQNVLSLVCELETRRSDSFLISTFLYRSRSEPEEVSRSASSHQRRFNLHYRGPAKGYLSALEEEKHQMEALIGTLLASQDPRARTLIQDIVQDPLAREVLSRVDRSIVGTQGRLQGARPLVGPQ